MSEGPSGETSPAGGGWKAHMTAASIDFVRKAEVALFNLTDPVKFVRLKEEIERVQAGEKSLTEWVDDFDAFVENL